MAVLTRAHDLEPDEYPAPSILIGMSDDALRDHAVDLLHSLESEPRSDGFAAELQRELRGILDGTP
jgi:hypothetical protein